MYMLRLSILVILNQELFEKELCVMGLVKLSEELQQLQIEVYLCFGIRMCRR